MAYNNFVVKNGLTVNGSFTANSSVVNAAAVTATSVTTTTNVATIGTAAYFVANGNVGIGTSNLTNAKFNVQSPAGATTSGAAYFTNGTNWLRHIPQTAAGAYNSLVADSDQTLIFSAGSVDTGNLVIGPWSSGSSGIKITSNGNVGIGTTTPDAKLAVTGTANLSGNVVIGGTATVTGNVTLGSSGFFVGNGVSITTLNATNITTGTLPYAQLGTNVVNTTSNFTISGTHTHAADITLNNNWKLNFKAVSGASVSLTQQIDDNFVFYTTNSTGGARSVYNIFGNSNTSSFYFSVPIDINSQSLSANGTTGSYGQLLTSNGSATFWSSTANNSTNLNGQAASYYTNIPSRLGYTPANKAGDTFSGDVNISKATPLLSLSKTASTQNIVIFGNTGANTRWAIIPGDATEETGVANAGSNFAIYGYTDAGAYKNTPLTINRNSGLTTIQSALVVGNDISVGTYISINGTTVNSTIYQGTSNNANNLNGQAASYYLNATNLASGTVPTARLATTGTASSSTYLRGDQTWASAVTSVANGAGLSGGTITTTGTLSLTSGIATPGTYSSGVSSITVDTYGRVTSVTGSGNYQAALGYTPANKAGDTFTGDVITTGTVISDKFRFKSDGVQDTGIDWESDGIFKFMSNNVKVGGIDYNGDLNMVGRIMSSKTLVANNGYVQLPQATGGADSRYVHNNSGTIGFLNTSNAWVLRVADNGNVTAAGNLIAGNGGGGHVLCGVDVYISGWTADSVQLNPSSASVFSKTTTAETNQIIFNNYNGQVGFINTQGSTTSYGTSSDYRLKGDVQPMINALSTISALKPSVYKWKASGDAGEGFIAHELQEVIPHAVSGVKDAVNEDGSIKPQGVDYSKIVVHLVAAMQEQQKQIADLQSQINALKK